MTTQIKIPDALYVAGVTTVTFGLFSSPSALTEPSNTDVAVVKSVGVRVTGNVEHGAVSAFATTEPTSAATFKSGTAFAGAVTTSSGIMSNGTLMRKIIADGTVSNIET